jgi:4a-hydroxytetrahydrobiopterin dehydratase
MPDSGSGLASLAATATLVPMAVLSDDEITRGLAGLPGWERDGDSIRAEVQLPSFPEAIAFVTRVGFFAEAANHHPDLDVRWRTVTVVLSTHDAGGITQKDLDLAAQIRDVAPAG